VKHFAEYTCGTSRNICALHASKKLNKNNMKSHNVYAHVSKPDTKSQLATHRELHLSLFARGVLLFDSLFFFFDFLFFAAFCAEWIANNTEGVATKRI